MDDKKIIDKFKNIWIKILGLEFYKYKNFKLNEYILNLKNSRLKITTAPSKQKQEEIINESANYLYKCGDII